MDNGRSLFGRFVGDEHLVDEPPEHGYPMDELPADEPSEDELPVDEPSEDGLPADELPVDEPSEDGLPADELPVDEPPAAETATAESAAEGKMIPIIKKVGYCLFFPLTIFYFEILLKVLSGYETFMFGTILLFSISISAALFFLGTILGKKKVDHILCLILISLTAVIFLAELILYKTFQTYYGVEMAWDNAANLFKDFGDGAVSGILNNLLAVGLYAIPSVAFGILTKKGILEGPIAKWTVKANILLVMFVFHFAGVMAVNGQATLPVSGHEYYTVEFSFDQVVPRFGLMTSLRLDTQYATFGNPDAELDEDFAAEMPEEDDLPYDDYEDPDDLDQNGGDSGEYEPNIDPRYDFEELARTTEDNNIKQMAEYFAAAKPTMKNEYTGLFEGKNLIFISAESFNTFIMSEELTPTLWKMAHEGFVLTEYYQPSYAGGTSSGEYSNLFGLMPCSGNAMKQTLKQDLSYTIGNRLLGEGYTGMAFHNGSFTYYDRDKTHKRLGYDSWMGLGNGLFKGYKADYKNSDEEMMKYTLPMYIDKEPFSIYYMTISGHPPYAPGGAGGIGKKNYAAVKALPYSQKLKYFIAQNLELEYAMKYLMEELEAAGKLDNTVFVISPDHYPYGLAGSDNQYFKEMLGKDVFYWNFDLMRNTGIIYCSSMESPVVVDKPTYSLDLYPTVMNLFGLTYDSRLFTGQDMLSDSPGLVIFLNYDWISDTAYCGGNDKLFPRPADGVLPSNEYVQSMTKFVKLKASMGRKIQTRNFFKLLNDLYP